jgi:predicted SnoaL-like aldol condensation-catalyzing enzyme
MRFLSIAMLLPLAAGPVLAQGYLSPLESNKKVVFDFYRLVFEPRNADLAEQFVAEDFKEHNPRFQSGRNNFIKMLKSPALIIAEGDLVTYIFKRVVVDPQDKSKSYERFSFDTFRVKDRKIVEHWDGATK